MSHIIIRSHRQQMLQKQLNQSFVSLPILQESTMTLMVTIVVPPSKKSSFEVRQERIDDLRKRLERQMQALVYGTHHDLRTLHQQVQEFRASGTSFDAWSGEEMIKTASTESSCPTALEKGADTIPRARKREKEWTTNEKVSPATQEENIAGDTEKKKKRKEKRKKKKVKTKAVSPLCNDLTNDFKTKKEMTDTAPRHLDWPGRPDDRCDIIWDPVTAPVSHFLPELSTEGTAHGMVMTNTAPQEIGWSGLQEEPRYFARSSGIPLPAESESESSPVGGKGVKTEKTILIYTAPWEIEWPQTQRESREINWDTASKSLSITVLVSQMLAQE